MNLYYRPNSSQRGNILFIILLAVVLFAALNYAVTQSMRGEGKSANSENVELAVSQLFQQASLYENTLRRFVMSSGLRPEQMIITPNTSRNGQPCLMDSCDINTASGGGLRLPDINFSLVCKDNGGGRLQTGCGKNDCFQPRNSGS